MIGDIKEFYDDLTITVALYYKRTWLQQACEH